MKLRLRRHEIKETLKLSLPDTATFHDLQLRINASSPVSVHLSLNRKDELLAPSPNETLRSLGVASGDRIYYSLDHSAFSASVHELQLASSGDSHQDLDPAEGSTSSMEGPKPMDMELPCARSKGLSKPFFLRKMLLEKSGDNSEFTNLVTCVHAVMLESGFVLLNPCSDKFSFKEMRFRLVSLKYTLPELINPEDTEYVTLRFQRLGYMVFVNGILDGSMGNTVFLDGFVLVIDLVMNTLKSNEEGYSRDYRKVLNFWRTIKDDLVASLLFGLCDKAGLELPTHLMRLPADLKMKILELLPGVRVAKMAFLCTELHSLSSSNDLWKKKFLEESYKNVVGSSVESGSVNWKAQFADFWRRRQQEKRFQSNYPTA